MIYYGMTYFIFRSWNQNLSFFIDPFISFLFGGLVLLGVIVFHHYFLENKLTYSIHSRFSWRFNGVAIALQQEAYNLTTMMWVNSILLFQLAWFPFSRLKLNAHHYGQVLAGTSSWFHHHVYDCYKSMVYLIQSFFILFPFPSMKKCIR